MGKLTVFLCSFALFLDFEWCFLTAGISAVWFVPMKKIFHHMFLDMDEYLIQQSPFFVLLVVELLTSGCVL